MKFTSLILALAAVSTAFGQTADSPKLGCLFLDLNSMSAAEQAKAQQAAIQFIQDKTAPADLLEIVTYTSKFNVIQDFTSDHGVLLAALRNLGTAPVSDDSNGRIGAVMAATASLNTALARFPDHDAGLVYVTTRAGIASFAAAGNVLRFNSGGQQAIGIALLPVLP